MVRRRVWWQVISLLVEMPMGMQRMIHLCLTIMKIDPCLGWSKHGQESIDTVRFGYG